MTTAREMREVQSAAAYKNYATISADVDLIADDPGRPAGTNGRICRAIFVGTPGVLVVQQLGGTVVTISAASGLLPIQAQKIVDTGTTAADILVMW